MKNIIWLASYPKSGNTWLRAFTSALLGLEIINEQGRFSPFSSQCNAKDAFEAAFQGKVAPETENTNGWRIPFQRQLSENSGEQRLFCKTHCRYSTSRGEVLFDPQSSLRAILIVRNPIDVAASLTNHFGVGVPVAINMINNAEAAMARNSPRNFEAPLGDWSSFNRSWMRQQDIPLTILRYEDMFDPDAKVFARFAGDVMDIHDGDRIEAAAKASQFDALQQKEARFGFDERPGRAERFFWKGRPWHGLEMLNSAEQSAVWKKHGPLAEKLGYHFKGGKIVLRPMAPAPMAG